MVQSIPRFAAGGVGGSPESFRGSTPTKPQTRLFSFYASCRPTFFFPFRESNFKVIDLKSLNF
ncbi:hypothetical protein CLW00_106137 [Mongoliibacter ruber]|uniref:Uncharacterized protein n=1 Tax=Mongoliibacter ruber TaxID=1750599 RepID=A0A2T0WLD2_9BACT|nr:hypothetical protein CLW00_106137 [Mongoliibacter ruber]